LTSRPSEGVCNVALIFHIETGSYDGTAKRPQCGACSPHTRTDGGRKLVGGRLYR
jgi:hypothetical protein